MQITSSVYEIAAATPWLIALGIHDWKTRTLPNRYTLGGCAVILVWKFGFGGLPYLLNGLLGGAVAGGLLLIPFFLRAAGGGDVKFNIAGGLLVGFPAVFPMLFLSSFAGLILGLIMQLSGRLDPSRLKHYFHCLFDWSYDRAEGRKNLPDRENEKVRIPFGTAIAFGIWTTLFLRIAGEMSR